MEEYANTSADNLVELRNISKHFGAVKALRNVNINIRRGEVHALVGGNGAGKSTLVRILAGIHPADSGELIFDGKPLQIRNPKEARKYGIATIHQNLSLVDTLDVVSNLYLGKEIIRGPRLGWFSFVDQKEMRETAIREFERLHVTIPNIRSRVARMSGGQRQAIVCTRAMMGRTPSLLMMDEPTAALGVRETAEVFQLMQRCKDDGASILLISHDMDEVFAAADHITVLRLGKAIITVNRRDVTSDQIVGLITGAIDPEDIRK